MNTQRAPRGIAMILTLLAVLVISTAGLSLVRSSTSFSLSSRQALFEGRARIAANDLRSVLLSWVVDHSMDANGDAGAPDTSSLGVTIDDCEVQVEAVDLAGCLHARWLSGASSIASSFPVRYRTAFVPVEFADIDWTTAEPHERPTLEELLPHAPHVVWHNPDDGVNPDSLSRWVTTASEGALNMQNTPIDLLRAALSAAGVKEDDTRRILDARRDSNSIDPGAAARAVAASRKRVQQDPGSAVPLTTRAGPWGFIVVVSQDHLTARWWIEVEEVRLTRERANRKQWTVTQFRRIP